MDEISNNLLFTNTSPLVVSTRVGFDRGKGRKLPGHWLEPSPHWSPKKHPRGGYFIPPLSGIRAAKFWTKDELKFTYEHL